MLRKLARVTFDVLTALSLLLCVALAALWVRSYWLADAVWYSRIPTAAAAEVMTSRGRLVVFWQAVVAPEGVREVTEGFGYGAGPAMDADALPFMLGVPSRTWGGVTAVGHRSWMTGVILPLWMPAAVLLILPAARGTAALARRRRHRARAREGRCPSCGYDLRASPGRCPECGTASPAHHPA